MSNSEVVTYTFELKDLNYNDLYTTYTEMVDFLNFLTKNMESAEVVKEENEGS